MTEQSVPNLCEIEIDEDDFRYYVKDSSVLDSAAAVVASDSAYDNMPMRLKMWDTVAEYRVSFETMPVSPVINPVAFNPDLEEGDYQNLYRPENSVGISWDTTFYDDANSMMFPKGMLKPVMPVVQYSVDAYQPDLELDLPYDDVPQTRTPNLVLPDIVVPEGGMGALAVSCNVCFLAASVSYSADSRSATVVIDWADPPSSTGIWVPVVVNGVCRWNSVMVCNSTSQS